ncbi:AMP-binding protein [Amnibacterium endophyticum]|uniref:AMP-binding protein n=1 Tax=Amnibacterium endophyticum TaxID=2109337 RepID=A0ABW4LGB7_9MICO
MRLLPVPDDPARLVPALRAALAGGPAVLPLADAGAEPGRAVPDGTAAVIRTSGSSGTPKAVVLSAAALVASARATERALGGPGGWVLALPGHYVAGLQVIVRALLAGGEPVPVAPGPFTASAFAAAVEALPPGRAYSALVPTQVHRVVEAAERGEPAVLAAVGRLDGVLAGGGRLAPDLADRAAALGLVVRRTYGASETAGGCVYDGVPLPDVRVRVEDGELLLAGPMLADGYLDDPAQTASVFVERDGGRWYRTGDAGRWDGERVAVDGRLDDVVITGGEKVSLGLVEQAVQALPGLAHAVVVRAPDAEWGEVPVVVTTADVDLARLRAAVVARLGRAAAPRRVLVLPELPLLPSGKPDRRRLTDLARS